MNNQAAWRWVTGTAYDEYPEAFSMGRPAHWDHLKNDNKENER